MAWPVRDLLGRVLLPAIVRAWPMLARDSDIPLAIRACDDLSRRSVANHRTVNPLLHRCRIVILRHATVAASKQRPDLRVTVPVDAVLWLDDESAA